MKIFVLGGTGYLGYNIVRDLVKREHKVVCVVRNTSDLSKIKELGIDIVFNSAEYIEEIFKQENFDWVINAVCTYTQNETLYGDMFESNVIFPLNVLNLAMKYKIKNYMTMGTGLPEYFNVYSFTKAKFSDFGLYLSGKEHINFVDLKLEMFYGGMGEPATRFIRNCILKLKNNEPILLTDGIQKRDIIHVDDIVSIIQKLIEDKTGYVNGYMRCPIGSGKQQSIRDVVNYLKDVMEAESQLHFGAISTRVGEPDTLADISWYQDISYQLKYNYFEGLKKYALEIKNEVI